jgi:hypothetical protein
LRLTESAFDTDSIEKPECRSRIKPIEDDQITPDRFEIESPGMIGAEVV